MSTIVVALNKVLVASSSIAAVAVKAIIGTSLPGLIVKLIAWVAV